MSVARVTVIHRRLLQVRADDGSEAVARPARRELSIVCGDFVRCELDPRHGELNVVAVEPRTSALYRSNARGGSELIAANLTLLLVVIAPVPEPDFFVVDRYLCAAQCGGLAAAVVLNKSELPVDAETEQQLADLSTAGYTFLRDTAQQQPARGQLSAVLPGQTAMLVGQSGVGKSSLLRQLVPASDAPIGALIRDDEGRHTTTPTRLYQVPGAGEIIDSPGG